MPHEPLAIAHPTGQQWADKNDQLLHEYAAAHGLTAATPTKPRDEPGAPRHVPSPVEGVLLRDQTLVAVAECKCRDADTGMTREDCRRLGDTYLITASKLDTLCAAAYLLGVPGILLAELACGQCWVWVICDRRGALRIDYRVDVTTTRATSLGPETIARPNAFVPFSKGTRWR